uniref:Uncharacterized protein n=1 Tax=Eptatretus burgeri TaxID=7764 RepID=A0A8C4R7Z9_EPTBU
MDIIFQRSNAYRSGMGAFKREQQGRCCDLSCDAAMDAMPSDMDRVLQVYVRRSFSMNDTPQSLKHPEDAAVMRTRSETAALRQRVKMEPEPKQQRPFSSRMTRFFKKGFTKSQKSMKKKEEETKDEFSSFRHQNIQRCTTKDQSWRKSFKRITSDSILKILGSLSYKNFQNLADIVGPELSKIALTMELTKKLAGLGGSAVYNVVSYGSRYLTDTFGPWLYQQGGWKMRIIADVEEEVIEGPH